MTRLLRRVHRSQGGVTLVEMLVALAVFGLFILMIDAVFSSARTGSRKVEVAADVAQNARVAVDRITRELRETGAAQLVVDTSLGAGWHRVLFKSARLGRDQTKFCLYTRTESEELYNRYCYEDFTGTDPPKPSQTTGDPPYPPPCDTPDGSPCMRYVPIWQRYVGYYRDGSDLKRVTGQLASPTESLNLAWLTGGDTIAAMVESFDVTQAGGLLTVRLKVAGTEVVQGRALPEQEILLPGGSLTRN
ncbi:MAG: prepilin-type N-terminal cleavage/methylation domain-containing protein [Armatimonadota bacterium]|nr:prepilin-type N-terminal cleavage/methylation domain-containing protein [Armatimonadota bacterium]MDR7400617.1 prepilin-type N-terminal cleavage/methylation domain-containing protein [Armatimonadota bacterium]MDR7403145.1 prepilin-type N-terminal cleavage/methylation domain-containing protein [Armatimonadota bacterium]MDR7438028.1 prepilin-type N-terminal cleavage/methylation domain-containing protein [Armatimonadota bacterium]MDR7472080.1 prepilin-type N-terminal cleavage/methylation domain